MSFPRRKLLEAAAVSTLFLSGGIFAPAVAKKVGRDKKNVRTRFGEIAYVDHGKGPVALFVHGVFLNSHVSRRDHVAVYVIRQFRQDRLPKPNREIVECGFFDVGALPVDTTPGTRLRIAEVLDGVKPIATWR